MQWFASQALVALITFGGIVRATYKNSSVEILLIKIWFEEAC